jgi:hypothetical protein
MITAARIEHQSALEAIDYYYRMGWTDGLPVVPPTEERVQEFIDYVGRKPDEVVASMEPVLKDCTIEKAAINAVMAGCLPEYFPVVLAALEACMDPRWGHFHGSTASTGGSAQLIIVNGPIRHKLGMNCGVNVFGPGNRANSTIGRAMRLIIINVFGMVPGLFDMSVQGHPGKYSYCIAENEEQSPWEPLSVSQGFEPGVSTVTLVAARGAQPVENRGSDKPEEVLRTIADTMSHLGALDNRPIVVVMGAEHAQLVGGTHGWSKQRVREFLWQNARRPLADLERVGRRATGYTPDVGSDLPRVMYHDEAGGQFVHQGASPDHILLAVAGGDNGGVSCVIPTWAYPVKPGDFVTVAIKERTV